MTFDAAISWLDGILQREVRRLRARDRLLQEELQGLYVSDARVEQLLMEPHTSRAPGAPWNEVVDELLDSPRWARLTDQLSLNRFERAVLLLALAPEIDPKYQTIYAY